MTTRRLDWAAADPAEASARTPATAPNSILFKIISMFPSCPRTVERTAPRGMRDGGLQ